MPTYVYEITDAKGNGTGRTFEWCSRCRRPR